MLQRIRSLFKRGSRRYPGVTSAIFTDEHGDREIDIDDARFNACIIAALDRFEQEALEISPGRTFTVELTTEEAALYNEDPGKFTSITQLQLLQRQLMLTVDVLGFYEGPPVTAQLLRGSPLNP